MLDNFSHWLWSIFNIELINISVIYLSWTWPVPNWASWPVWQCRTPTLPSSPLTRPHLLIPTLSVSLPRDQEMMIKRMFLRTQKLLDLIFPKLKKIVFNPSNCNAQISIFYILLFILFSWSTYFGTSIIFKEILVLNY